MQVRARVIDIGVDAPTSEDSILIDTNVWYWLGYERASLAEYPPNEVVVSSYSTYVKKALEVEASLYWCGISFAELAHNIEQVERKIYEANLADGVTLGTKKYRREYPRQRVKVLDLITAAWDIVTSMTSPLNITVDEATMESMSTIIRDSELDGYDLFFVEAMKQNRITKILTDDGDFVTVTGIEVFTANHRAIREARDQGKLLER